MMMMISILFIQMMMTILSCAQATAVTNIDGSPIENGPGGGDPLPDNIARMIRDRMDARRQKDFGRADR